MKKILSVLVLISFLAVLLVPILASADIAPTTCTLKRDLTTINSACTNGSSVSIETYGMCCLLNTIYNVTDWIFVVLAAVAALFVILGGLNIVTAGGSPEKVASGRNYIMYAVIGLVVAILAKAVPSIVKMVVGV